MLSNNEPTYLLIVDEKHVLNFEYRNVIDIKDLADVKTSLIWAPAKIK
jgi:hypothetical protein